MATILPVFKQSMWHWLYDILASCISLLRFQFIVTRYSIVRISTWVIPPSPNTLIFCFLWYWINHFVHFTATPVFLTIESPSPFQWLDNKLHLADHLHSKRSKTIFKCFAISPKREIITWNHSANLIRVVLRCFRLPFFIFNPFNRESLLCFPGLSAIHTAQQHY